jgi:putative aminopeptidase FrvX
MLLSKLCNSFGVSGYEYDIRDFIKKEAKEYVENVSVDNIGNIIAHKECGNKKIILDVHIDEVGLIITGYNEDGTFRFNSLGKIDTNIIPCQTVFVGEDKIPGVIGFKPIHIQKEKSNKISYKDCCIDIGCNNKNQAKNLIKLGDSVVFDTKFSAFGGKFIKGKALDNRIGCFILLDLLKNNYNLNLYGVFNCQEKIGARGAQISSYRIKPDLVIIIDVIDIKNDDKSGIKLGSGPIIPIISKESIFDKKLHTSILKLADKKRIPYQVKTYIEEVKDVESYFRKNVISILVPCKYASSSISVASIEDIENTKVLIEEFLNTFSKGE